MSRAHWRQTWRFSVIGDPQIYPSVSDEKIRHIPLFGNFMTKASLVDSISLCYIGTYCMMLSYVRHISAGVDVFTKDNNIADFEVLNCLIMQ